MAVLLLLLLASAAQEPVPQQPPAAPADAAAHDLAFLPVDERMTVPVQIAGAGPFRFVIDTGAQRTVISRELAGTLGLPPGRDVRLTAMTGTSSVRTVVISSITVSTLGGRGIEAPALEQRNLGAAGMLGIDSLQGHSVGIDFDRNTLSLSPSRRRPLRERREAGEIVVRARSLFGQLVVTDATVNGTRVRIVLDTGSPVSIGNEALRRRVGGRTKPGPPITLLSVTGQLLVAPYGSIAQVRVGAVTINSLPIAFSDVKPFAQFGLADKPAILLGMDALRLFRRVDIDFANREVRLLLPRNVRTGTGLQ
jgi:predicted aspartyl protease